MVRLKMSMSASIINENSHKPIVMFYNTTVNVCRFSKGLVGNFMVQIFFQDLLKHSNHTISCPLKKVNLKNITISFPQIFYIIEGVLCCKKFTNLWWSSSEQRYSIDSR